MLVLGERRILFLNPRRPKKSLVQSSLNSAGVAWCRSGRRRAHASLKNNKLELDEQTEFSSTHLTDIEENEGE